MHIGICSPFMPHDLVDLLDDESRCDLAQCKGVTATPVTPLAREWHRRGYRISVFCLDPSLSQAMCFHGERLTIHALPKRRFRLSARDFYRQERAHLCEAILSERPDVIHANWSYEHALAAIDSQIPTVVTCHDTPLRYAWIAKNFFMTYHVLVAALVFHRASHLIAVSPYTAHHIQRYFRPSTRVGVIPNGLAMDVFQRGKKRRQIQRPADRALVIASVGGWGTIKNTTTLLTAFATIRKAFPQCRLVLFGHGLGTGQEAEAWAAARNLTEGVLFRGSTARSVILDFLAMDADLMIHTSLVECHPMVLIEAIACGVPVLAGAESGGVAWTLGEGRHGALCNVRDPRAISSAAIHILQSLPQVDASSQKAWHEVRKQFGIETVANEYLSLFSSLP
jgi:L-malate glycosyltransferase